MTRTGRGGPQISPDVGVGKPGRGRIKRRREGESVYTRNPDIVTTLHTGGGGGGGGGMAFSYELKPLAATTPTKREEEGYKEEELQSHLETAA